MLPPRFIDTVQMADPALKGSGSNNPAAWSQVTSTPFSSSDDVGIATQLTRRYTYWNYIAISRIAERMAQTFPCIGLPVVTRGTPRMSQSARTWLTQRYGWETFAAPDMDVNPLPDAHPFVSLMKRVNPRDTWQEFIADLVTQWELTGRYYLWLVPNGLGLPAEMWVLPTAWVNRVYAKSGALTSYEIIPQHGSWWERFLPPEEVVCGEYRSPLDPNEAWSSLRAAPHWAEANENIERSRSAHFRNGVLPDLIVQLDREIYGNPNDDVIKRIKERLIQRTAGVARHGEPYIIPAGVKVDKWSNTPKEMDYADSAVQIRDNELAKTGTPAVVAGVTKEYNRDTAESAFEVWCEVILNPKFRRLAGVFQKHIAARFDERILVYYLDCRPRNAQMRLEELTALADRGGLWPNEFRQEIGLPRVELPGYDTGYLPASFQPIELASERADDPLPPDPTDDGTDEADSDSED